MRASAGSRGVPAATAGPSSGARAALLFGAWLVACGGKYVDPGNQLPGTGDPEPSASASSSAGSSSSPSGSLPSHPLGQCVPGFDRSSNPSRACPWVTQKGECFASFDGACACVCPTSGNSLCSAGFSPGANGATSVYCDKD